MRILVHEYAGHPFQLQLSRALAARGHDVRHAYCASLHSPRGDMVRRPQDAATFSVCGLDLGETIPKDSYVKRFRMERSYGRLAVDAIDDFNPDVVLSANTPSLPQIRIAKHCRSRRIRHVFWVQDVYGVATYKLLKRRVPVVGRAVGLSFIHMDKVTARSSDAIVAITEDFLPLYEGWGVDRSRLHVVHNWSDLGAIEVRPRENAWSEKHHLKSGPRFIYTGTMAMKHNPALLLELAKLCDERGSGEVIVVSEGIGAGWLQNAQAEQGVKSLRIIGFIPFDEMADCLGSADALVAILEPDAGVFSVPSKVLSYLCAGRAILAAMPAENLAARILTEHGAGVVAPPDDLAAFRQLAEQLLEEPASMETMGAAARRYAEEHFDIDTITDRFEAILAG